MPQPRLPLPTLIGLCVALGGPPLLAGPAGSVLGDPHLLRTHVLGQLCLWAMFALLLAIILWGERKPLSSIGIGRLSWSSIALGIAIAGLMIGASAIISPVLVRIGWADFSKGFAVIARWPLWFRVAAGFTAGVVEETFYRGYAIERLASLTGSRRMAAVIALVIFGLVHLPLWGPGILFNALFGGGVFTLLYLWRRDLWPCIIAHSVIDIVELILVRSAAS